MHYLPPPHILLGLVRESAKVGMQIDRKEGNPRRASMHSLDPKHKTISPMTWQRMVKSRQGLIRMLRGAQN
jgi:hypothetical protein